MVRPVNVVKCQTIGCTLCCEGGSYVPLAEMNNIQRTPEGDCVHLKKGVGCKIYGSAVRPQACNNFSCEKILESMEANPDTGPMFKVVTSALRLRILNENMIKIVH